ncbi:alpha/beta fold hydrolase [Rhodococcus hoagii]|nr:alpha/beta fold hydrolase [Prescottella equi]
MRVRRTVGWVSAAALSAAALPACGGSVAADTVAWEPCTGLAAYVTDLGVDDSVVDRLQCASLEVPLNYADPGGRTVELALSRVQGTDPAAPALFVNPGGPGVEGRSMAATVASDLGPGGTVVGIDLRGTGYSTAVDCALPDEPDTRDDGSLAAYADAIAAANRDCVEADPEFLGSLTTANAARDVDAVRGALGLDTVDFLGVSWGTVLGAELQSTFPTHLRRVVLDSMDYTVPPRTRRCAHSRRPTRTSRRRWCPRLSPSTPEAVTRSHRTSPTCRPATPRSPTTMTLRSTRRPRTSSSTRSMRRRAPATSATAWTRSATAPSSSPNIGRSMRS